MKRKSSSWSDSQFVVVLDRFWLKWRKIYYIRCFEENVSWQHTSFFLQLSWFLMSGKSNDLFTHFFILSLHTGLKCEPNCDFCVVFIQDMWDYSIFWSWYMKYASVFMRETQIHTCRTIKSASDLCGCTLPLENPHNAGSEFYSMHFFSEFSL